MTIGERLLKLTAEYQQAVSADEWGDSRGRPTSRPVEEIAAEFEEALRQLHAPA